MLQVNLHFNFIENSPPVITKFSKFFLALNLFCVNVGT